MLLFVIMCHDKEGAFALRQSVRETHLAYVAGKGDSVLLAGPMMDNDGQSVGSVLIIEAESLEAAQSFADNDPYSIAGLFQKSEVKPFRIVRGSLVAKKQP